MKFDARAKLLSVTDFFFFFYFSPTKKRGGGGRGFGGHARRTLTVRALGDRDPLGRYGLVRSGIIRNG